MKIYADLTNVIKVSFITGIQRVVREIMLRMIKSEPNIELITYVQEHECFQVIDKKRFTEVFGEGDSDRKGLVTGVSLKPEDFEEGSLFFDIDSVWNARVKRSWLFPELKKRSIKICTQLYDIIPITHPQYCHEVTTLNFMNYLGANIKYADLIITSAKATERQLKEITDKAGLEQKKCAVVPLGSDFRKKENSDEKPDKEVTEIATKGKYILMVGTIEPRKNHSLVLDALDEKLADLGVNVVFAGRIGWNVSELENRIKTHPKLNKNLFFVTGANDATIDFLYKNAYMVAFPTFDEGFGLPIIESFQRGTPVIASDIEVLREVGGDFADYFKLNDRNAFIAVIEKYLENPKLYEEKKKRLKDFVPYTWDESADEMLRQLRTLDTKQTVDREVKQMVVLTARNEDIIKTLPFIEAYMPFIKELLVCCPPANTESFMSQYKGKLKVSFLTDDELLADKKLPADHAKRNFFLRCLLMQSDKLDKTFIMTDDDYRPLFEIGKEVFLKDGHYNGYYCYDLREWKGTEGSHTSFDLSMFKTLEFLKENDMPTLQYSSHQPQIIDRDIYRELINRYRGIEETGLDEWSVYFNYGVKNYPDLFRPQIYISMCWPGSKTDWNLYVQPKEYVFENYYSGLYSEQGIFNGFSEEYHNGISAENIKKVVIYSREMQKQAEWKAVFEDYCAEYRERYMEEPSFYVWEKDNEVKFTVPPYMRFAKDSVNRFKIMFQKGIFEKLGTDKLILQYYFSDVNGNVITYVGEYEVKKTSSVVIPVVAMPFAQHGALNIRCLVPGTDKEVTVNIKVQTL